MSVRIFFIILIREFIKTMKDYYYILGIEKTASEEEIKTTYKKLSKKFHPDMNEGDKFFENQFKEIQEAYNMLTNIEKKAAYDIQLKKFHSEGNGNYIFEAEYYKRKLDELQKRENELGKYEEEMEMHQVHSNPLGLLSQMFTKPRKTFEILLQNTSNKQVNFIFATVGCIAFFQLSFLFPFQNILDSFLWIIIAGSLGGITLNYLASGLLYFSGRALKGNSTFEHLKIMLAWLNLPLAIIFLFEVLHYVFYIYRHDSSEQISFVNTLIFQIPSVIIGIWTIFVTVIGLSELQKFSIIKASISFLITAIAMCGVFYFVKINFPQ